MCGRYALSFRPREVRQQLEQSYMPVDEAPEDDDVRQSYNFAPGYHGLVYRANTPDSGAGSRQQGDDTQEATHIEVEAVGESRDAHLADDLGQRAVAYKLQVMKWGLIPFWTKRAPDYGSTMKTINCRDDSLYEDRGMWTNMKRRKRCIVVAQGFYEWLKKNNGREKIPHFVKRRDGQLMCFAGLWDCVKYEGSEEKLYTYTIITTDSNKQLKFLHDRMPVILDNGSDAVRTWLDPTRSEWSKELQALLKPYDGELDIYPVPKDVGKVGNNSPTFIVPLDSKANKNNIANFFGNQKRLAMADNSEISTTEEVDHGVEAGDSKIADTNGDGRKTVDDNSTEDNAPKPAASKGSQTAIKAEEQSRLEMLDVSSPPKNLKRQRDESSPSKKSPGNTQAPLSSKKLRSSTSNGTVANNKSPAKAAKGSQKITAFFGK